MAGWVLGLLLGPIGLIIVFSLENKRKSQTEGNDLTTGTEESDTQEFILCPRCHKETDASINFCKNCGQLHGE